MRGLRSMRRRGLEPPAGYRGPGAQADRGHVRCVHLALGRRFRPRNRTSRVRPCASARRCSEARVGRAIAALSKLVSMKGEWLSTARVDGFRDCPAHGRAPAGRRDDLELTADGADAVAHPDQAVAVAALRLVDSHPIINDREMDSIPVTTDAHANAYVAPRMLDRVLDRLEPSRNSRRLDRRRAASVPSSSTEIADRCRRSQASGGVHKTAASQHGRIDAVRQPAQLLDRRLRVVADRLELRGDPIVLDLLLRQPKLDLDRHQPLLGAVMKIALEPTALVIGGRPRSANAMRAARRPGVCSRPASARSPPGPRPHRRRYRASDRGSETATGPFPLLI